MPQLSRLRLPLQVRKRPSHSGPKSGPIPPITVPQIAISGNKPPLGEAPPARTRSVPPSPHDSVCIRAIPSPCIRPLAEGPPGRPEARK